MTTWLLLDYNICELWGQLAPLSAVQTCKTEAEDCTGQPRSQQQDNPRFIMRCLGGAAAGSSDNVTAESSGAVINVPAHLLGHSLEIIQGGLAGEMSGATSADVYKAASVCRSVSVDI